MTLEIIHCVQQSEEWYKCRLGIVTASHFGDVLAKKSSSGRKTYLMKLLAEIMTGQVQETYSNSAMQWGVDHEAEAREFYGKQSGNKVEQIGFIRDGFIGCSPDGLIDDDGTLEIKCPFSNTHLGYILDNVMVSEYVPQVQGGLMITGRKWCDFVSYDPRVRRKPMFLLRVKRDEDYIQKLKEECAIFVHELKIMVEKLI